MAGYIVRQPNGLLCRHSTVVDCVTHYNFTDEQYLDNYTGTVSNIKEGIEVLNEHLKPFDWILSGFIPNNMTVIEFRRILKDMGYTGEIF